MILELNTQIEAPMLLREATIRMTKTNKPFLSLKVFTGQEELSINLWDWKGTAPEPGDVWVMAGTVTEWSGIKQLDCKGWREATSADAIPADYFLVRGPVNIESEVVAIERLMEEVTHSGCRALLQAFWATYGDAFKTAPGAKGIHHAYAGGLLQHIVGVCTKALALAGDGPWDRDLIITGALLHDIGKLKAYAIGVDISMTDSGVLMDHIPIGICMVDRLLVSTERMIGGVVLSPELRGLLYNIILSHHGRLDWGSPVTPKCGEAWLVHLADMADSKLQVILEHEFKSSAEVTEKVWPDGSYYAPAYVRRARQ